MGFRAVPFYLFASLLLIPSLGVTQPFTIDTSTSATATANSPQRKTFFDSGNDTHWTFYYNGSAIEYSYSADGESWTSAGTLPYNTASFSAIYKTIGATSYVFVVAEANTYDVVLRRGELGAAVINFDAAQTIFDGSSVSDHYTKPTAALSENDHLWISSIKDFGPGVVERFQVQVRRSTNLANGDLSVLNATTSVGAGNRTLHDAVILPQNDDGMYLISSAEESNIIGYSFDGANWTSANTGGDFSWFGFGTSGFDNSVRAIVISGSDLYVGGEFQNAGGVAEADRIAKWDGNTWTALGSNGAGDGALGGTVLALAISGSDLYVGGSFTNAAGIPEADYVAKWDGNAWSALGNNGAGIGALGNTVQALAISGADVYVGGSFTDAGGETDADRIARWNTTAETWNAMGLGISTNTVYAIAISGSDIYVGGDFTDAGGVANTVRIARWNGAAWVALGSGISTNIVYSIAITGSDIYVGGSFTGAGGIANTARIARWDGAAWNAVGSGLANGIVHTITISGSNVYLGGTFNNAGGDGNADKIVRRDTSNNTWNALASGLSSTVFVTALSGTDLYAGGYFIDAGGIGAADRITKWNGTSWNALDTGGINATIIYAMVVSGSDLYVGGAFNDAGGIAGADNIARWDGSNWHALGAGANSGVFAIAVSGANVYIGGNFTQVDGGVVAPGIAVWDGDSWSDLGGGVAWIIHTPPMPPIQLDFSVNAITISGSDIYVGGLFNQAGGVSYANIARWDGASWNALGTGAGSTILHSVNTIQVAGSDIYVGGVFPTAGGVANTENIARWDGADWHPLNLGLNEAVRAIAVSGSDIYVGGQFTAAGGVGDANYIARWDGTNWNALGTGITGGGAGDGVYSIAISGSELYVGGQFTDAGGVAATQGIAKWDGVNWSSIGISPHQIYSIVLSDSILYLGGSSSTPLPDTSQLTSLAYYTSAIATDNDATTELSTTTDNSGNVYLTYTNEDDEVKFRRYDEADAVWKPTVTLNATASSSPSVSYKNSDGRVTASWIESNAVSFRHAASPYEAANWIAETTLYNTGINAALASVANQETGDISLFWTNGGANPYSILTEGIDMSSVSVVTISSGATNPTKFSPISITVQFSEDVTDFIVGDITVGNGTAGNFVAVDGDTYTADITPTANGTVTVNIAAGVAHDEFDNDNLAASQFSINFDAISPTVAISSTASSPTTTSPIPISVTFSEDVTGFAAGDITVTNGTLGTFVATNGTLYTARITPTANGAVKVNISAGVAVDAATNLNTAASQFSITYKHPSTDTDGDGVSDLREETDGTNPLDSGSYHAVLPTSWCSDWNGFLGLYNINEYLNLTNVKRVVIPTLFDITGEAKSSLGLDLLAGAQTDLLVHDMPGWTVDSYGKVCSEVIGASAGNVDGRMVYYKPSLNGTGYDFAFALPYYDGLKGKQFLTFNNMQPSADPADSGNFVANWVQLTNLEETAQNGTLFFYAQDGSVLSQQNVSLAAEARQDFSAHDIAPNTVGTIEWRPTSTTAKFGLRNTRYYYDNNGTVNSFDAALQLEGTKGSGERIATLLDTRSQTAVLEVANTTASTISAAVKIYNAAGLAGYSEILNLAPYQSVHIVANQYLTEELGSATVDGSAVGSILAVGMHYGRTATNGISHIYGLIAKQPLGTTTRGSYNTYLGQSCELLLVNATNSAVNSTVRMTRLDGTTVLAGETISTPAFGSSSFSACAEEEADQYGVVTVESATRNSILPTVIRSGANGDYRFVTPVR